jgi:aminobenzoyl-glutamate transport protein
LLAGTPWRVPGASDTGLTLPPATAARGLRLAGLAALVLVAAVTALSWRAGLPFRGDDGSYEPLLRSLVAITFVVFLVCGIVYGTVTSSIRSDKDAVGMMNQAMADMGGYIVLAFFAAVFLALFTWSNLAVILSVNGAAWLQRVGFLGMPLLLALIVVTATINVVLGSASAKWAILAPVLVPMLMPVGISPEWTQAAYRVGDTITNPITPLLPYFPLVLITARRYVPEAGIGSMVALMLPYSIWFGLSSVLLLVLWFVSGLPLGPGL